MNNVYLLVLNGTVVNSIVATPSFIATIQQQYSGIIQIDPTIPGTPGIGWTTSDNKNFIPPVLPQQSPTVSISQQIQNLQTQITAIQTATGLQSGLNPNPGQPDPAIT